MRIHLWGALVAALLASCGPAVSDTQTQYDDPDDGKDDSAAPLGPPCTTCKTILFVWDGLRPDLVNPADTPNLAALAQGGVEFLDHHSTYPTFTMMNAASFATGGFPAATGFYGNTFWQPGPSGTDSGGRAIDFSQPIFSEDWGVLHAVDTYYQSHLLLVGTLFKAAQDAGLKTAAIGKSGPAFLQDYGRGGLILDEKLAWPLDFARDLQTAGFALPRASTNAYNTGDLVLAATNGDPTAALPKVALADGITPDPTDASGTPTRAANQYLMHTYLEYVLPQKNPDLSVIWLRNPDATQHTYGVGAPNSQDGLRAQDELLGQLLTKLHALGLDRTTDVIVVSDHGHSNVSGPTSLFPLRKITNRAVGDVDAHAGSAVSGYVRLADLMTRAGFAAFDGSGCAFDPVMSGIKADGTTVYATQMDADGSVCGMPRQYTTGSFRIPATLPAHAIVIAANGGSDYLYVPDHDAQTVENAVRFLQSREQIGAIFVADRYGAVTGTLPLSLVRVQDAGDRHPDVVVSFAWDDQTTVNGVPGIEWNSVANLRGMHGSFSPYDVHNTLVASGPHFRRGWQDWLPTGNVDVAPTLARIFHLPLPQAQGRPLREALRGGSDYWYSVDPFEVDSTTARSLTIARPTDAYGGDVHAGLSTYQSQLFVSAVRRAGSTYLYFDFARAVRR